jgi:hypothetical protein
MKKKFICITTQREMFHRYPDAPNEVSFLKNLHRHLMKVKVAIQVVGNEREIEFFMFQRKVNEYLEHHIPDNKSCEAISDLLATEIKLDYPDREIRIEISEDGENSSYCEYTNE